MGGIHNYAGIFYRARRQTGGMGEEEEEEEPKKKGEIAPRGKIITYPRARVSALARDSPLSRKCGSFIGNGSINGPGEREGGGGRAATFNCAIGKRARTHENARALRHRARKESRVRLACGRDRGFDII